MSGFGHLGFEKPKKVTGEKDKEDKEKEKEKEKEEPTPIYAKVMMYTVGTVWNQKTLKKVWNPLAGLISLVNKDMIGETDAMDE